MWRIYYADMVVEGATAEEWLAAPDDGVQVVVLFESTDYRGWKGVSGDRQLWTGDDEFDPFGFGVKRGLLIPDDDYLAIWERAIADSPPDS